MRFSFRFRPLPFIAMVVVVAIGISLGQWQLRRAAEKEAIEQRIAAQEKEPPLRLDGAGAGATTADAAALEFRQVVVRGEFLPGWTIYLDNRPYAGRPGFHVITPLKIAGSSRHIIVARGWIARDMAERSRIPEIPTPQGVVEVTGSVRLHAGRLLQLGQPAPLKPGAIVQNLDAAQLAQASGLEFEPFIVEQSGDSNDGLVRDWPRPSLGIDRHLGYAFQWFALAATAFLFYVVTGFKRASK
jgi:cytochrome oxidase assembly protein ShyY1